MVLHVFVSLVQAYIFMLLTMFYVARRFRTSINSGFMPPASVSPLVSQGTAGTTSSGDFI
jgi:hypothetical protein